MILYYTTLLANLACYARARVRSERPLDSFGIRDSKRHGETLDMLETLNHYIHNATSTGPPVVVSAKAAGNNIVLSILLSQTASKRNPVRMVT